MRRRRPAPRAFGPGPYVLGARVRPDADCDPPAGFPFDFPAVRALPASTHRSRTWSATTAAASRRSSRGSLRFDVEGATTGLEMPERLLPGVLDGAS
ncbi:MAG TPA: hypothetical protein VN751_11925 [Solirubrobacteraceae bacterium]|nr:hypothetical protein [Solirubrobacteraceae bacterium]